VAHRQEEKQRRREERLARERAEKAAAARKKRLQLALGAVLAIVAIGAVAAFAVAGLGGGGDDTAGKASQATTAGVELPQQQTGDLNAAAQAAGCTLQHPAIEGRGHSTKKFTPADYKTNPPTSGDHNPNPAPDGTYPTGNEPAIENWVHTLEHGRVLLMYKPGAPQESIAALQKLYEEDVLDSGKSYHMVLMQNNSKMPFQTAAVAWQHYVGCNDLSPAALEAMRTFRDRFVDQGPEFVP
jgi:hypothetical protein